MNIPNTTSSRPTQEYLTESLLRLFKMKYICSLWILTACLCTCSALPVGPRIPDGNAGMSVQPGVYVDSGVGFHEIEGVSKYIRVGQNPKQQTVETVIGQKVPPGNNRELSVEDKSQDSILRFLNRQILSVPGEDETGSKKAGSLFDNLSTELEVKIKLMTWEFQKTALAMKENFKNDSEREEALQTIEGDIDVKMSEIAKEFGETENAEQKSALETVSDAIKRRMRLIFSHNVHYDKDNL